MKAATAEPHEGHTGVMQKSLKWGKRLASVLHFMDAWEVKAVARKAAQGSHRGYAEVLEVGEAFALSTPLHGRVGK